MIKELITVSAGLIAGAAIGAAIQKKLDEDECECECACDCSGECDSCPEQEDCELADAAVVFEEVPVEGTEESTETKGRFFEASVVSDPNGEDDSTESVESE